MSLYLHNNQFVLFVLHNKKTSMYIFVWYFIVLFHKLISVLLLWFCIHRIIRWLLLTTSLCVCYLFSFLCKKLFILINLYVLPCCFLHFNMNCLKCQPLTVNTGVQLLIFSSMPSHFCGYMGRYKEISYIW